MPDIVFKNPELLWLLALLLPLAIGYVLYQSKWNATVRMSSLRSLEGAPVSWRYYMRHLPTILRFLSMAAVIVGTGPSAVVGKLVG